MRHLFLINPAAGKKDHTREFQAQIAAACSGLEYEVQVSRKPGDITALARQAANPGNLFASMPAAETGPSMR